MSFIAAFNKDVVRTDMVSETNAVTYKFRIGGATNASPNPFLFRNDDDLLTMFADGLNVREFNSVDGVPIIKSFNFSTTSGNSINSGFISYLNASTAKLIILFSGKNLRSASDIDNWFKSVNSQNWPASFMCNNYSCGYVAIYSPSLKKIISEVAHYTDGTDKSLARYDCVYDVFDDIGSLGFSKKIVYDGTEYTSNVNGVYKPYIDTNFSGVNIKSGDILMMTAEMFSEDTTVKNQLFINWFNGSTFISQSPLMCTSQEYSYHQSIVTVPDGANRLLLAAEKNGTVNAGIKNVTLSQTTPVVENIKTSFMSVNGIKASKFVEKNDDYVMELNLEVSTEKNVVPVVNIQEANGMIKYQAIMNEMTTLPDWLKVSRMSKATALNSSGLMIEYDIDTARFGYDWDGSRWFNRGLIIEKQSTNYIRGSFQLDSKRLAQPSFNKCEGVPNPLDQSKTSALITRTASPGNWLLLSEANPPIDTNSFTLSSYFSYLKAKQFGYRMDTYKNASGNNVSLVRGVNEGNNGVKVYPSYNYMATTVNDVSAINVGTVYVGQSIQPTGNLNDDLMVHTWQLETLPYASSFIITPSNGYATRMTDNLILDIPNYTGTVKMSYMRHDTRSLETKYIDVHNSSNFNLSQDIDVGFDLIMVIVFDYILSNEEKNV